MNDGTNLVSLLDLGKGTDSHEKTYPYLLFYLLPQGLRRRNQEMQPSKRMGN